MGCKLAHPHQLLLEVLQFEEKTARDEVNGEFASFAEMSWKNHPMSLEMIQTYKDSLLCVIDQNVYDCTKWQWEHPGGRLILVKFKGKDATADFHRIHSVSTRKTLPKYFLAPVARRSEQSAVIATVNPSASTSDGKRFEEVTLLHSTSLTPSVKRLTFGTPKHYIFPPGGHVKLSTANWSRAYSPIESTPTTFTIVVKCYPNGKGSQYLHQMKVGDRVRSSGPLTPLCSLSQTSPCVWLVGGGTGVAPLYSVAKDALDRHIAVHLWASFHSRADFLLEKEFGDMKTKYPTEFIAEYCCSSETGRLSTKNFSSLSDSRISVMICGPPAFSDHVEQLLLQVGISADAISIL